MSDRPAPPRPPLPPGGKAPPPPPPPGNGERRSSINPPPPPPKRDSFGSGAPPPPPPPGQRPSITGSPRPPPPRPPAAAPTQPAVPPPPKQPATPPQPPRQAASSESSKTSKPPAAENPIPSGEHRRIWIPDKEEVWVQVDVVDELPKDGEASVTIRRSPGATSEEYLLDGEINFINPNNADDMTALHHIHEAGILHNLRNRSLGSNGESQTPYTFMASALLAVNPLKPIQEPVMYAYIDQPITAVSPHPYSIAELAYKNLNFSRMNQSVIISGESGAGKTETAKIILRYLVERNAQTNSRESIVAVNSGVGNLSDEEQLDLKLLRSSPIMESFGNAKTVKNHNSSRFGKLLKLCFIFDDEAEGSSAVTKKPGFAVKKSKAKPKNGKVGGDMNLAGARVETYLLEKNRVTHQAEGECNYHIFYHLLADHQKQQQLHLNHEGGGGFNILSKASVSLFEKIENKENNLGSIAEALLTTGFSAEDVDGVWQILAGIMHLGNVAFEDYESKEGEIARIKDENGKKSLKHTAEVWGVTEKALCDTIMSREMFTAGEAYVVPFTAQEASFARDATVKAVYEALFELIVRRINRSLISSNALAGYEDQDPAEILADKSFVGVLDIFGFENFQQNGLEQLLINYANEALQNTFNHQLFDKELELFRAENIEFSMSECPSNKECVDLIAGRTTNSIFKIIDAVGRQAKSSDERFCEEVHKAFSHHKHFPPIKRRAEMRAKFNVLHYAGEVTYTVASAAPASRERRGSRKLVAVDVDLAEGNTWLAKNRDSVPDALADLYHTSSLSIFKALAGEAPRMPAGGRKTMRRKSVMMKPTISATFSKSMAELNALLLSTNSQFIRCIKPNAAMKADAFDNQYVVKQIRSLGVLQACEVLKASLPTRVTYEQLKGAMPEIVNSVKHLFSDESETVVLIACLLRAFQISPDVYRLGRTMVFFRPGQLASVQSILTKDDSDQDKDIIASIEASYQLNKKAITLVSESKNLLAQKQAEFTKLENDYEKLIEKAKDAPEVRDLDLPSDLVEKISQIEVLINRNQNKQNENNVQLLNLNAALLTREEGTNETAALPAASADYLRAGYKGCQEELNAATAKITTDRNTYRELNDAIQKLEDESGGLSPNFQTVLDSNDTLYEQLQVHLEEYEEAIVSAKDEAERCRLDQVELTLKRCTEIFALIAKETDELHAGIARANAEYSAFEDSGKVVNFDEVQAKATLIVEELKKTQVLIAAGTARIIKYEGEMQAELTNPRTAAVATTANRRGSELAPPSKPAKAGKINFSIKDLTALKQRKAQQQKDGTTESAATTSATETTSSVSAAESGGGVDRRGSVHAHISLDGAEVKLALPEGWRELEDKKTGRKYYVNSETKERQWNRPLSSAAPSGEAGTGNSSQSRLSRARATARVTSLDKRRGSERSAASFEESGALPEGWRAAVDKKTGRTYYVHAGTKKRQWQRPEGVPAATNNDDSALTAEGGSSRQSRVLSRRLILKDVHSYLEKEGISSSEFNSSYSSYNQDLALLERGKILAQQKIEEYRARAAAVNNTHHNDLKKLSEAPRSVSQLTRLGRERKVGILMKQGRFLGRWKKRYFVLQNGMLEYYDSAREAEVGHNCKAFVLSGSSMVTYTSTDNCFAVSDPEEGDPELHSWYLLANSEKEMEEWMTAINAHIHTAFAQQYQIETDFWEEGTVATSFWMVPVTRGSQRRPVGIRTLPIVDGPRTGEGLYPGEIVEVVQIIDEPPSLKSTGQKFLRLANDRGWVFESHPSNNYTLMMEVPGELNEEQYQYQYSVDCLDNLESYSCPACNLPDMKTGVSFAPGQVLQGCAEWTTDCPYAFAEPASVSGEESVTFVKVGNDRGWVPMYHPLTGGELLLRFPVGGTPPQNVPVSKD